MWFGVLGPLQIQRGDNAVEVTGAMRRRLLAVLLARANESVSADALLDRLWDGRRDAGGAGRLQVLVHRIRGLLDEPDRLTFGPGGYRLRVEPDELDAERFCALLDEAESAVPARAAELAAAAMTLWRGEPYGTLPELEAEAAWLNERRLAGLERLYEAELRCGRHGAAVPDLQELVRAHPLRERLHALLMTALYQGGRQDEALAVFRSARATLVDELGLEPGPELRAVERAILIGEPLGGPTRPTPAQLPPPVPGFVGRAAELAQLDGAVGSFATVTSISGTAGVGKTAVAVRWAWQVKDRYPDGQLFIDMRGYGPDEPLSGSDALGVFLRALGIDGDAIPEGSHDRVALFRSTLADKRVLIVLDNAADVAQVRPLMPGAAGCMVVVTSRHTLAGLVARDGARRVDLPALPEAAAVELLGNVDPITAGELVQRCARLPLALRIVAERVRVDGLDRVLADLRDELSVLDVFDAGDDADASLRAVFAASYRHLDTDAARMFRLLGMHPGHDIDLLAATALAGDTPRRTRRHLDALVRANLVIETADHRYQLHDLLWVYTAEIAEDDPTALTRLTDYYLSSAWRAATLLDPLDYPHPSAPVTALNLPVFTDYATALAWLDVERGNLIPVALRTVDLGLIAHLYDFSTALAAYLDLGWYHADADALHGKVVTVAASRGDVVAHGSALRHLGLLTLHHRDTAGALSAVQAALVLHQRGGDRLAQAETVGILGALYGYDGQIVRATHNLQTSIDLYRATDHAEFAFRPLIALGNLLRKQREYDAAAACLTEALTIADRVALPLAQTHAHRNLVALYRDQGRHRDALPHAESALAAARAGRITLLEGLTLNRIATLHRALGDYPTAHSYHAEARHVLANYSHTIRALAHRSQQETHRTQSTQ